ncbi:hypothetical protein BD289DRAFT_40604 [Coniella lustricola]|uniref:Uncharacterized protein n=1 Tax=Coniella lustricola TaxID=2025994 RepID=A0A2T3A226_9PEZI|nr:hypothetical protein BD289DRAFT_40604 [Coniella lustricola]
MYVLCQVTTHTYIHTYIPVDHRSHKHRVYSPTQATSITEVLAFKIPTYLPWLLAKTQSMPENKEKEPEPETKSKRDKASLKAPFGLCVCVCVCGGGDDADADDDDSDICWLFLFLGSVEIYSFLSQPNAHSKAARVAGIPDPVIINHIKPTSPPVHHVGSLSNHLGQDYATDTEQHYTKSALDPSFCNLSARGSQSVRHHLEILRGSTTASSEGRCRLSPSKSPQCLFKWE